MRTFKSAVKAILSLLLVSASTLSSTFSVLAITDVPGSGEDVVEPINLEEDSAVLPSSPDSETATSSDTITSSETTTSSQKIAIRAINPGYNLPAGKNSGELIELINLTDDELDISGLSIVYISKPTSASPDGKETILYTFPKSSTFIGDVILLRYASSPESIINAQDLTYDVTSLAMAGSLKLVVQDEENNEEIVLDSVCWLGGEDCLPIFSTTVKSRSYTTIFRDDETGERAHVPEYNSLFDPARPGLLIQPEADILDDDVQDSDSQDVESQESEAQNNSQNLTPVCSGLRFTEFLTYYVDDPSEQFIEIYNSSHVEILLDNCRLRYKNKIYPLSSAALSLKPDSYFTLYPPLTLTKDPSSANKYELLDVNDEIVDSFSLPHGQKKSTSLALMGENPDGSSLWKITYSPTPGERNSYQEFRNCPTGKVINELTGNCVNAATVESVLKDCGEGKYRNPLTGRCKSYDSDADSEPTPCKEGYERNPETNRCRKIKENNGADYPLVPITDTSDNTSFIAVWALVGVICLGLAYVLFQFRRDIYYSCRRLLGKFRRN